MVARMLLDEHVHTESLFDGRHKSREPIFPLCRHLQLMIRPSGQFGSGSHPFRFVHFRYVVQLWLSGDSFLRQQLMQLRQSGQTIEGRAFDDRSRFGAGRNREPSQQGIFIKDRERRDVESVGDQCKLFGFERSLTPLNVRHRAGVEPNASGEFLRLQTSPFTEHAHPHADSGGVH